MVKAPHDLNLLDDALFALVLRVGRLFGESLYCEVFARFDFFSQVNRCEVALADLLFGLELLMEAALVKSILENISASL